MSDSESQDTRATPTTEKWPNGTIQLPATGKEIDEYIQWKIKVYDENKWIGTDLSIYYLSLINPSPDLLKEGWAFLSFCELHHPQPRQSTPRASPPRSWRRQQRQALRPQQLKRRSTGMTLKFGDGLGHAFLGPITTQRGPEGLR
jgi:hypothetical protein